MIIHDVDQKSDEWKTLRLGRITGSMMHKYMTKNRKGDGLGETALNAVYELMAQRLTGIDESPDLSNNIYIRLGNELEPRAIAEYELETFNVVKQVGFIEVDDLVGGSPDGLVGDDGLIEVKCKNNANHLRSIIDARNGIIDKAHVIQMQFLMWITDRKWCDYVLFNENFTNTGKYKCLEIFRIEQDEEIIHKIIQAIDVVKKLID
jgi:exodeoxyribonuclease (lambda-induced)